jgi:Holliday junction resolvasome RuvABC endonuclease subunit
MPNKRKSWANTFLGLDVALKSTGAVLADIDKGRKSGYVIKKVATIVTNVAKVKTIRNGGSVHQNEMYVMRSRELFDGLMEFTDGGKVRAIVAEMPNGGGQNAIALAMMMCALGAVSAFAAAVECAVVVVQPTDTKAKLCGSLSASKKEVEDAVRAAFNDHIWPKFPKSKLEHIFDAAGALLVGRSSDTYLTVAKEI